MSEALKSPKKSSKKVLFYSVQCEQVLFHLCGTFFSEVTPVYRSFFEKERKKNLIFEIFNNKPVIDDQTDRKILLTVQEVEMNRWYKQAH